MTSKNIYHSAEDRTPYVYVIKHLTTSRYYIGVRFAKNCHPSELLLATGYTTSSKIINDIFQKSPNDLSIHKITIFDNISAAREFETRLLRKLKAKTNQTLINFHENETRFPYGSPEFEMLMFKKYGVRHSMHMQSTKDKLSHTVQVRYNCSSVMLVPNIKEKFENTMLERHGGKYSLQSETIKSKIYKTNLERYGTIHTMQNTSIKEKAKQTCIRKYGVDNVAKSPAVKVSYKKTCLDKYGVDNAAKSDSNRQKQSDYERQRIASLRSDTEWVALFNTATHLRKIAKKSIAGLSKMSKHTLQKEISLYV